MNNSVRLIFLFQPETWDKGLMIAAGMKDEQGRQIKDGVSQIEDLEDPWLSIYNSFKDYLETMAPGEWKATGISARKEIIPDEDKEEDSADKYKIVMKVTQEFDGGLSTRTEEIESEDENVIKFFDHFTDFELYVKRWKEQQEKLAAQKAAKEQAEKEAAEAAKKAEEEAVEAAKESEKEVDTDVPEENLAD